MITSKKSVQYLASVLQKKGITDIVFSPGSRNAPLINTFAGLDVFRCLNIVDERSAAFFALGMAIQLRKPVAIACTSGSAMLNYAPAIAEAYYQKVPLLVLTADRPVEWVDQNDGQTIRQQNTYTNYVKSSYSLPEKTDTPDEEWYVVRILNQAVNDLSFPEAGPVHINIPLSEPLYHLEDVALPEAKMIRISGVYGNLLEDEMNLFASVWNNSNKILILVGQMSPSMEMKALLNKLSRLSSVIILSETTSNLRGENLITCIDNVLSVVDQDDGYGPDLLITLGGQVVSKKIKTFLRKSSIAAHWHFSRSGEYFDTYQSLTNVVTADPLPFLGRMSELTASTTSSGYGQVWKDADVVTQERHQKFLSGCTFSDLKVFETILDKVPENSVVHLSNSTPIRYSQLFVYHKDIVFQSNRGTSGIDGVVSTAAGSAFACDTLTTVITGDLAFFYDSNSLWNNHLTGNLRIIVINNGGGGIFRFLDGSSAMPALETHFEAQHNHSACQIAQAFQVDARTASDRQSLAEGLDWLYREDGNKPALLEILTPNKLNAEILKAYFKFLKG
jgi:2-succinyl-5-enolpyruvyl-6-hydroxy-3-cyclohexene-1-carboxylate synthase